MFKTLKANIVVRVLFLIICVEVVAIVLVFSFIHFSEGNDAVMTPASYPLTELFMDSR